MSKLATIAIVAALAFVGIATATAEPADAWAGCTLYKSDEIPVYDPTTGKQIAAVPIYECAW